MSWELLWSIGRYDLRLTEEEFWSLTLREFFLLVKRWKIEWRYREAMAAITPWILATIHRDPKKSTRPWAIEDFTIAGLMQQGEPEPEATTRTGVEVWSRVNAVMRAMGGKRGGNRR